jgi:hypothetical protein
VPDDANNADRRRVVRAFLLAPLTAPTAYAAALILISLIRSVVRDVGNSSVTAVFGVVGLIAAIGVPVAYVSALVGGLPLYLLLRRIGRVSRVWLLIVAAAIGVVVSIILEPQLRGEMISFPFPIWVGAILGLVSGEAFWRLLSVNHSSS